MNIDHLEDTKRRYKKIHGKLVYKFVGRERMDCGKKLKLRLYRNIKQGFMVEPHLHINVAKYKIAISRLRLSLHHLGIEVGRHA